MTKFQILTKLRTIRELAIRDLEEDMEDFALVAINRDDIAALEEAAKAVEAWETGKETEAAPEADISHKDFIYQITSASLGKYLSGALLRTLSGDVAEEIIRNLPTIWELVANEEARE